MGSEVHEGKAEGGPEDGRNIIHYGHTYRMRDGEYHWSDDHESWVWYGFTHEPTPVEPDPPNPAQSVPGYERLRAVLEAAYDQAARGKGKERHAKDLPFHEQPMQTVTDLYGLGFPLGQAAKKGQEAQRMEPDAAIRELLGAINYLAGAVIWIEDNRDA